MATLKFACPHCRQPLEATDDLFGKVEVCLYCGKRLLVPSSAGPGVEPGSQTEPAREAVHKQPGPSKAIVWLIAGLSLIILILFALSAVWFVAHQKAGSQPAEPAALAPQSVATVPDEALFVPRQTGPAAWRIYPPKNQDLPVLRVEGTLESLPPYILRYDDRKAPSRERAARIMSDPAFMITVQGNTYNIWAVLEQLEGSLSKKKLMQIPHFLLQTGKTIGFIEEHYGKADHIGSFAYTFAGDGESGQQTAVNRVYWYGVIFFIVGDDGALTSIGGWPSRL